MRRDFMLPETDRVFLEREFKTWETILQDHKRWLILRDQSVPDGYQQKTVDLALMIETNYPIGQLDMIYVYPTLIRMDGKTISNTQAKQPLEGKQYQRWSRHRTKENPWRPGEDCVETHLNLVHDWFRRELEK
ncbi:MAG TPA: E2/UBC family protein [Acidobacteriota bacterium]|nr:E2/UBC family protein [Acidobacteriota bacterium]